MAYKKGESGNPDGRPAGVRNKCTLVREALGQVYENGEAGFWLAMAEKAKEGDSTAVTMLAARLVPPLKASDSPIALSGLATGTLSEKANNIVSHMGDGLISPSEATSMLNAIAALCRVTEIEVLASRLASLERILKERK
jgi:hypothetical protein